MNGSAEFLFECPDCGETIEVNGSMKAAIVESGCVVCGADISPAAFEEH